MDSIIRDNVQPTCTPDFTTRVTNPASDANDRPNLPDLPAAPVGGCGLSSTTHTSSNGRFFPDNADFRDDTFCRVITQPEALGLTVAGSGTYQNAASPVTLTATPTNVQGTASYVWTGTDDDDIIGAVNTISGADTTTALTGTVTVTDSGRTAPNNTATATWTVSFQAADPQDYSFVVTFDGGDTNHYQLSGGVSRLITEGANQAFAPGVITATPNAGTQWTSMLPTATISPDLPTGLTLGAFTGVEGSTNPGAFEISGTWTPAADYTGVVTVSGGETEPQPAPQVHTRRVTWTQNIVGGAQGRVGNGRARVIASDGSPSNTDQVFTQQGTATAEVDFAAFGNMETSPNVVSSGRIVTSINNGSENGSFSITSNPNGATVTDQTTGTAGVNRQYFVLINWPDVPLTPSTDYSIEIEVTIS